MLELMTRLLAAGWLLLMTITIRNLFNLSARDEQKPRVMAKARGRSLPEGAKFPYNTVHTPAGSVMVHRQIPGSKLQVQFSMAIRMYVYVGGVKRKY
jgi:hypothetical protein